VAHAMIERDLGDYIHTGVAKLERNHRDIGLAAMEKVAAASLGKLALHCLI